MNKNQRNFKVTSPKKSLCKSITVEKVTSEERRRINQAKFEVEREVGEQNWEIIISLGF